MSNNIICDNHQKSTYILDNYVIYSKDSKSQISTLQSEGQDNDTKKPVFELSLNNGIHCDIVGY